MEQTNEAAVQSPDGEQVLKFRSKKPLMIAGIVLGVVLAAYLGLCAYAASQTVFYPNYAINGIDMSGLTVEQAQSKLEQELPLQEIALFDADNQQLLTLTLSDLGYTAESFSGDAQFWFEDLKRDSFFKHGWTYLEFLTHRFPGGWHWPDLDEGQLNKTAQRLSQQLFQPAIDTSFSIVDQTVEITKAKDGRSMDALALSALLRDISTYCKEDYHVTLSCEILPAKVLTAQELYDEVSGEIKNAGYDAATQSITPERLGAEFDVSAAQQKLDAAQPGESVSIPATIEHPRVTAEALKGVLFRDVLGECRTHVGGSAARISNVKLASAAFNGTVLNAGDVFSYNETVGQRTIARGYQAAPAYVKGETVDEVGGGVCQPSSTLYLACLRSNLEITERYAHRYVPAYIDWGMDATVSWGGPDYRFTNNTDYPVKVVTSYSKGYLTVKLLGTKSDGVTVKMTNEVLSTTPSEVIYEDDPTLAPGTEQVKTTAYTGYKVRTFRNLYDAGGKLISSKQEAVSNYKSRNKVILRGPALPETAPAEAGEEIPRETPVLLIPTEEPGIPAA